jgi:hypothetical protein
MMLLILCRNLDELGIAAKRPHELKPDRQRTGSMRNGNRNRRVTGRIDNAGENPVSRWT